MQKRDYFRKMEDAQRFGHKGKQEKQFYFRSPPLPKQIIKKSQQQLIPSHIL